MIKELSGDDCGVWRDENHRVVEWREADDRVVFSYTQVGDGMSAHFACQRRSLREVKTAINDFVIWVFWAYPWCRIILALIDRPSVARIVEKCGFKKVGDVEEYQIYGKRS